MQTINEALAAKFSAADVARVAGSTAEHTTAWKLLLKKFLSSLLLALSAPAF